MTVAVSAAPEPASVTVCSTVNSSVVVVSSDDEDCSAAPATPPSSSAATSAPSHSSSRCRFGAAGAATGVTGDWVALAATYAAGGTAASTVSDSCMPAASPSPRRSSIAWPSSPTARSLWPVVTASTPSSCSAHASELRASCGASSVSARAPCTVSSSACTVSSNRCASSSTTSLSRASDSSSR